MPENNSGRPYSRWQWLTLDRLVTFILFLAILAMAARFPTDSDSWWHLQSGRWIVEHRAVPIVDPFSHSRYGQAWIDHGWLAQIFIYLAYHWLGYAGLVLLLIGLVLAAFYFAWLQCQADNGWVRAFVFVVAAVASAIIWAVRPQMVSFMLTGLVALLLYRYKQGNQRAIWGLPAVMIVWANSHGGFAVGFILMAAYLFGEVGNELLALPGRIGWRRIGQLALVAGLCFLLVPLNPNGTQLWAYPFRTVGIGILKEFIAEWQPPDFHQFYLHPFIWLLLAALTAFGLAGRRADFTDLTLVALFAYLSFVAVRNIPLFALVTAPVIVRYGSAALDSWLGRPFGPDRRLPGRKAWLHWFLLLLLLFAAFLRLVEPISAAANQENEAKTLPAGAIAYLNQSDPAGPIFNFYNWGGYLIWHTPQYPVFVDGRTDLYDDDFLAHYLTIYLAQAGWHEALDQAGINLVVVETFSPLALALENEADWRQSYADDLAIVYERR